MTFRFGSRPGDGLRVAVLMPPRPKAPRPDQDDTYVQVDEVTACLRRLGHRPQGVEYVDHGPGTSALLAHVAPDVVFNLVEEVEEGPENLHLVTDFLESRGYAFTGARSAALRDTGNKLAMKRRLADAGLPTPPLVGATSPDARFIVKSAVEHGSFGMDDASVVEGEAAAHALVAEKSRQFGGTWFAEAYIDGREIDIGLLETASGILTLPPAEILFVRHAEGHPRLFHYASKWDEGSIAYMSTPRIFPDHEPLFDEMERLAKAAWTLFGITGCAHVDFRVDRNGRPFILEVNANPGLTDDAGIMRSVLVAGLTQTDVVAALVERAVARSCASV